MNEIVSSQVVLFLTSLQVGIVVGIVFDMIRILRKMIKHHNFFVQVEDMIFWVCSGFIGFYMLYNCNYADIRPFILIGILMGAIFYFLTFSIVIMKVMTYIIDLVKYLSHRLYIFISTPIKKIFGYILIPINKAKRNNELRKYNKRMLHREKLRKQYQLDADKMTEVFIKDNNF